jgi:hypothetical protein
VSARDTTFNLGRVQRALGVKGPINPRYRVEDFSPVAIVADFSSSFAPEAIEGRRIWAQTFSHTAAALSPSGHATICLEIMARAPGGLVIEHLELLDSVATAKIILQHATSSWAAGGWLRVVGIELGGIPTTSIIDWQFNLDPPAPPILFWDDPYFVLPGTRTYIAPGEFLRLQAYTVGAVAHVLKVAIVAREIPESIGAP